MAEKPSGSWQPRTPAESSGALTAPEVRSVSAPPTKSHLAPAHAPAAGQTSGAFVLRNSTLDGFSDVVSRAEGVGLTSLDPITLMMVRTQNTLYRITVLRPPKTHVIVQGGRFFPEPTEARLWGSSFGGSFLKMAWVGVGLRMEICANGQLIITSPVRTIDIQPDAALPGPF